MKKIFTACSLLIAATGFGQWTQLNSTTTAQLNDVDFLDENYGVIVGEAGTILHTTDGGITWNDINHHNVSGDVFGVKVKNTDTVYVSTWDWSSASAAVYRTSDLGLSWQLVAADAGTNHRIDLEENTSGGTIYAADSKLLSSDDFANTWDTLLDGIAGTLSTDQLTFANATTGHLSGNISGWITYSAQFFRTEDGQHWYQGNAANFLNSDALTTMAFVSEDTAYVFMNQYAGFAPSATNRLVRIRNFNLAIPAPGDTSYTFSSTMINTTMPDYMNDAKFTSALSGWAFGNTGKVYKTTDGGVNWTIDFNTGCSTCALLKSDFANGTGYAVGNAGTLVKYALATNIAESTDQMFSAYPNPSSGSVTLKSNGKEGKQILEVLDVTGKQLKISTVNSFPFTLDAAELPAGSYLLRLSNEKGEASFIRWIKL